jgi:tetratricopeptide (TPR) repeat protein
MRSTVWIIVSVVVLAAATSSPAQTAPTSAPPVFAFRGIEGPHSVGLKVVEQYDYSRIFLPRLDDLGKPSTRERARPLQTLIWYPAQRISDKKMTVRDYMKIGETQTSFGVPRPFKGWFIEGIKPALASTLWSVRNAPPVTGRFPVVIYAPSFWAPSWENADLCEYIASYGYVVIASPGTGTRPGAAAHDVAGIDAPAKDILFLIGYARTLSNADTAQIGVVGFSWGGLSSLFAAARDDRIKALVALDGSMRYFPGLVKEAKDVDPQAMTIPLLYFKAQEMSLEDKARFDEHFKGGESQGPNVLNEWTHGDLYSVQMLGLVHPEFDSLSQRIENFWKYDFPHTQEADYGREDGMIGYALVARYTREFLDAYLKHDAEAFKLLRNAPAENGVPAHVLTMSFRAAQPMPPAFGSFQSEVFRQGFGHAAEVYATFRKEHPDVKLDTQSLEGWGNRLLDDRHFPEAIEIMKLAVQADPSSDAYFSLGETYRESGQLEQAVRNYREALARDPSNSGAKERLSEYGLASPN